MLDEAKMRRLAMIQYMYTLALDHVNKPEPLNMVAILNFHDAVELFLALAAEHLNVCDFSHSLSSAGGEVCPQKHHFTLDLTTSKA